MQIRQALPASRGCTPRRLLSALPALLIALPAAALPKDLKTPVGRDRYDRPILEPVGMRMG